MKLIACLLLLTTGTTSFLLSPSHLQEMPSSSSSARFSTRFLDFDPSAAKQSGAGAALVDMNQYNLQSLDEIVNEWSANLVIKSANTEGGVKLFCKSSKEILVDTLQVKFPRTTEGGLGILLQEIAGGRDDGLGITLVSGLVEGGPSEESGINAGDSIVKVTVVRERTRDGPKVSETEEQFSVETECFGYDAMVDAIGSLPPPSADENVSDTYVISLKRLRRKPKVTVRLQYPPSQDEPDEVLELFSGEILRQAMLVRGVKLNDELAKRFDNKAAGNCGANGLCTTCAVSVLKGGELLNPMKNQERQMMTSNPRWRLACKSVVGYGMQEGDMTIRVNPRQWDDYVVENETD